MKRCTHQGVCRISEQSIERTRRRFHFGLAATVFMLIMFGLTLMCRVEWGASRSGPQPWALMNDGAITFGAGELAGGPGRPGWLISFSPPGGMDVQLVPFVRFNDGMMLARLPLWIPLVLTAVPTVMLWRRVRRKEAGRCAKCHYDLTGHDSTRCPECGTARPPASRSS